MNLTVTVDCMKCMDELCTSETLSEENWPKMKAIDKNTETSQMYECLRCHHRIELTLHIWTD